jgi:hypothetical protein
LVIDGLPAHTSVAVYDLAGRRMGPARDAAEPGQLRWNFTDEGASVLPGIYFVRLRAAGGASRTLKLAVLP